MVAAIGFGLYVLFIMAATTSPFQFHFDGESIRSKWAETEWVFFYPDQDGGVLIDSDLILNIFFFVPLGVAWVFMVSSPKVWRAFASALIVGLLVSLMAEALQVLTPDRTTQVADLWRNALGAGLGGLAAGLIRPPLMHWSRKDRRTE